MKQPATLSIMYNVMPHSRTNMQALGNTVLHLSQVTTHPVECCRGNAYGIHAAAATTRPQCTVTFAEVHALTLLAKKNVRCMLNGHQQLTPTLTHLWHRCWHLSTTQSWLSTALCTAQPAAAERCNLAMHDAVFHTA